MTIPPAALQQHIAILGKTGSGKTFAAKGALVEPWLEGGRVVGIVDPTGAWWGMRTSRDGHGDGFPVLILGGDHGDLPLDPHAGAAVARLLAEQRVSLVADTSLLTVGERTRWFIDFAGTLYRLNKAPVHLVLDEAHNFAPQGKVPDPDTGRMLHAANTLASGGRSRGIRLTMITQRPQKLHKDALTSADTLIALRVLAPHDRAAVKEWIDGCADPAQGREVLASLAGLPRGEGWVWYAEGGFLERLRFPAIRTFDSSATPVEGEEREEPRAAAALDLTAIRGVLAQAEGSGGHESAEGPRLRARIASLERELASRPSGPSLATIREAEERGYVRGCAEAKAALDAIRAHLDEASAGFGNRAPSARTPGEALGHGPRPQNRPQTRQRPAAGVAAGRTGAALALGSSGKRRMLTALAQHPDGLSSRKLSILTGISQSGGTWRTYLGELRGAGWVEGGRAELLCITAAGEAALGPYEPLPTGPALRDYWRSRLGGSGKRAIFDAVVDAYPDAIPAHAIAQRTGIAIGGGTWRTYLGELRGLELIDGRGELRASPDLFE